MALDCFPFFYDYNYWLRAAKRQHPSRPVTQWYCLLLWAEDAAS